jgi:predicted hydrocarbon binding protein
MGRVNNGSALFIFDEQGGIMFKEEREVSSFKWSDLGNIELGRPNLGPATSVAVYRLMQFTLRDAAIKHTDVKTAERIFYDAGYNSGKAIYENLIGQPKDFAELVAKLQKILKDLNIGILNVEKANVEKMDFTLTVGEDLDCSGLPAIQESVCTFDEGFIAGILDSFAGVSFDVKEVDCWCTGDKVCRFNAKSVQK